jgi:uncharacterized protein (DUF58 family)
MTFAFPPLSATKDIAYHPLFRGAVLRWVWRTWAERVSPAGRGFAVATLLFLHFSLCSLEIQAYAPLCYAAGLWLTAAIAAAAFRPRAALRVRLPERAGAGEIVSAEVEIQQLGRLPLRDLRLLPHRLPPHVDAVPENGVPVPVVPRGEKARVKVGLRCSRRGAYLLQGFRLETGFPFGLLLSCRSFEEERTLIVHPRFTPLSRLRIPSGRRHHPEGVAMASNVGDSLEYLGNREYRYGDSIRDVDWRATARLGTPIVREYREEFFLRVAVVLDTHVPKGAAPARREDFERAVSICAAVSDYMLGQDYLVDLCAVGPNLYEFTAGRSLAHLDQILDLLAHVQEHPVEAFSAIAPGIMSNLSKTTTVVCVLLDWNETRRAFIDELRRNGAAVRVIIVRDGDCTLDPSADAALVGPDPVLSASRFAEGVAEL